MGVDSCLHLGYRDKAARFTQGGEGLRIKGLGSASATLDYIRMSHFQIFKSYILLFNICMQIYTNINTHILKIKTGTKSK